MKVVAGTVLAGALLLAGCGGDSDTGGSGAAKGYGTASALASAIGCSGFELDTEGQMYVKEIGSCQLGDADVYVQVFADNGARDQWLEAAKAAGAGGSYAVGDKWVVQAFSADAAKKAADAAGGEVRE